MSRLVRTAIVTMLGQAILSGCASKPKTAAEPRRSQDLALFLAAASEKEASAPEVLEIRAQIFPIALTADGEKVLGPLSKAQAIQVSKIRAAFAYSMDDLHLDWRTIFDRLGAIPNDAGAAEQSASRVIKIFQHSVAFKERPAQILFEMDRLKAEVIWFDVNASKLTGPAPRKMSDDTALQIVGLRVKGPRDFETLIRQAKKAVAGLSRAPASRWQAELLNKLR